MTPLKIAIDRLEDMLKGDDGQAWKEAEKALPGLKKALELESRSVHLSQLSWGGFNLHGDEKSIREAQRLLHEAAKVPALYERIDELQKATPQWLPIESAPKNTLVLIGKWIDGDFNWALSEYCYERANVAYGFLESGWVWSTDEAHPDIATAPEFWHPLPTAPIKG